MNKKPVAVQPGPIFTTVSGLELDASDRERLLSPAVGGVVLFARNCESAAQVEVLTEQIHQLRTPELLIAIDQEGGRVQRLKEGVTRLPPQQACGNLYDQNSEQGCDVAELAGYLMASDMRSVGIDISFSPVLDVPTVTSDVIGNRAFHSDPSVVSMLANAWTRGMQKAGMKAVGKHFPGHGAVSGDSHFEVPEDGRDIQQILNCDLMPYRRLGERLSAIMTAHVLYPEATTAIPTYSMFWLEHILREVLVFHGPVFSDDLSMSGAAEAGDMETRVLTALMSGCDFALICQSLTDTDRAIEALLNNEELWRSPGLQLDQLRPDSVRSPDNIEALRENLYEFAAPGD